MSLIGKKILITGGAGFIGSHLVEEALKRRMDVRVLDDLSSGKLDNIAPFVDNIEFIRGSVVDERKVRKALKGVDFVLHEAACVGVFESMRYPKRTVETNVIGTLNLLEGSLKEGVERFVFASSAAVYGEAPLPNKENSDVSPNSPYALTKLWGEDLCEYYWKERGLETIVLRYFNAYGPKQDPNSPYAAVIPSFIKRAMMGKPLIVHGDGKQTQDFIYVGDVVRANYRALQIKRVGEIINVCTGKPITIEELARKILEITRSNSRILYREQRPGDIRHSWGSPGRMKRILKIRTTLSLKEGLKKLLRKVKE